MINVSKAFKRKLYSDDYSFINSANITLANGIVLDEITNTSIMSSGLSIEDAVGSDEAFDALGSTVINSATLTLYNKDEIYSNYDFDNAKVVLYTALEVDTVINGEPTTVIEKIKKGTFTVDNATFGDSTITLTMLDNMEQFDRPYSLSNLSYPASLGAIVRNACSICDVTLATNSLQFPHCNFTVQNRPDEDSTTFREVIGWCATIAGCFASCNPDGQLELKWYDTSALENNSGTDGGIFDNANVDWLLNYMNTELGMAVVSSSRADDTWFKIDNTFDFEFNGTVSDYIYINSNSCYAFADTQPSNNNQSVRKGVNILTRDGQSISIKYQELSVDNNNAIKVRFHGYTNYKSSAQTREYELEYEIFFVNNGTIVVNFITLPTNTSYLGTSNIIENSISYTITPTTDNIVAMYRQLNGRWSANSSNLPYLTGDKVYGGIFNPWDNGDDVDGNTFTENIVPHYITSLYNQNIGVDDVIITGVKITVKIEDTTAEQDTIEYLTGTEDYLVEISENPFITKDNANTILSWLSTQLVGLKFRKCNVTHVGDPTIEAGDVGLVWDTLGGEHPILISRVTFSPGSSQTIVCGAKTVSNNNSTRFSTQTKNFVSTRKQLRQQREEYQAAMDDLAEAIENANGLYETDVVQQDQSIIRYLHNKPELSESDIQIIISDVGITMTPDGGQHWYGMTVDGQFLASVIQTIDLFFDYARGGTLTLGGNNNVNGTLKILNASGTQIGQWNNNGINITSGAINLGSGKFKVTSAGALTSTSGQIGGFTIGSNDLSGSNIRMISGSGSYFESTDGNQLKAHMESGNVYLYDGYNSSGYERTAIYSHGIQVHSSSGIGTVLSMTVDGEYGFMGTNGMYIMGTSQFNYVNCWNITASGTKSRVVETHEYGDRLLYCYETPTPMFGDIGEGTIGEDGLCYVVIDPIFANAINTSQYQVFLQKYGKGEVCVKLRYADYFIVEGTPNIKFGWEIKAKQRDFEQLRLDKHSEPMQNNTINYGELANTYIDELMKGRYAI